MDLVEDCEFVVVLGGFFYGDYLRVGFMVVLLLIMLVVLGFVVCGGLVFGICNGF